MSLSLTFLFFYYRSFRFSVRRPKTRYFSLSHPLFFISSLLLTRSSFEIGGKLADGSDEGMPEQAAILSKDCRAGKWFENHKFNYCVFVSANVFDSQYLTDFSKFQLEVPYPYCGPYYVLIP